MNLRYGRPAICYIFLSIFAAAALLYFPALSFAAEDSAAVKAAYETCRKSYTELKNAVDSGADQSRIELLSEEYRKNLLEYQKLSASSLPAAENAAAAAAITVTPSAPAVKPAAAVEKPSPGWFKSAADGLKKFGSKSLGVLGSGLRMLNEVFIRPLQQGVGKLVSSGRRGIEAAGAKISPKRIGDQKADLTSVDGVKNAIEKEFAIKVTTGGKGKWTLEEIRGVYETLQKMPPDFRKHTKVIQRDAESERAEGYVTSYVPWKIHLCGTPYYIKETLVHEMTHCYQFANLHTTNDWNRQFFGSRIGYLSRAGKAKTSSVTEYGDTNSLEDSAESVREYFENPKIMKEKYPDRYEFVKTRIMSGVEFK
jgi:hypothetical protein